MTRCAVSVFAAPYRPRKSTAGSARAFGQMAGICGAALVIILAGLALYLEAAVLK